MNRKCLIPIGAIVVVLVVLGVRKASTRRPAPVSVDQSDEAADDSKPFKYPAAFGEVGWHTIALGSLVRAQVYRHEHGVNIGYQKVAVGTRHAIDGMASLWIAALDWTPKGIDHESKGVLCNLLVDSLSDIRAGQGQEVFVLCGGDAGSGFAYVTEIRTSHSPIHDPMQLWKLVVNGHIESRKIPATSHGEIDPRYFGHAMVVGSDDHKHRPPFGGATIWYSTLHPEEGRWSKAGALGSTMGRRPTGVVVNGMSMLFYIQANEDEVSEKRNVQSTELPPGELQRLQQKLLQTEKNMGRYWEGCWVGIRDTLCLHRKALGPVMLDAFDEMPGSPRRIPASGSTFDLCAVADDSGRIFLTYAAWEDRRFSVRVTWSSDKGQTWAPSVCILSCPLDVSDIDAVLYKGRLWISLVERLSWVEERFALKVACIPIGRLTEGAHSSGKD